MSRKRIIIDPIIGDGYWIDSLTPQCPGCGTQVNCKVDWDNDQRKEKRKCYTCGNIWLWKYVPREARLRRYLKRKRDKERKIEEKSKPKPPCARAQLQLNVTQMEVIRYAHT